MDIKNLLESVTDVMRDEFLETLRTGSNFRLERIVSKGHVTPPGDWYDQEQAEWVLLLSGAARLRMEDQQLVDLGPGDSINIPAQHRHRVEWTDPESQTVWLALHYS